jgi:hypothetical protein
MWWSPWQVIGGKFSLKPFYQGHKIPDREYMHLHKLAQLAQRVYFSIDEMIQ